MEFWAEETFLSSKKAAAKFEEFRQNSKFCDVNLQSGRIMVKAHRTVLAAASQYFKTLFTADPVKSHGKFVTLPSVPPNVLPVVVDFIYTGHVIITSSTAHDLMTAAHELNLDGLVDACALYFKTQLDHSNAVSMLSFAETVGCSELAEHALDYIKRHWTTIAQGKEYLSLASLSEIIMSSNKFAAADKLQVVRVVVRWLEHEPAARAQHCLELVHLLRQNRVPPHALADVWRTVKDETLANVLRECCERTAVAVANPQTHTCNTFYVVGHSKDCKVGSVFKYDVFKKTWEVVAPMKIWRRYPGVAALDGRLYVVGGGVKKASASGEVYDPATNKWSPIAKMRNPRVQFGLAAVKGKLYAFGGRNENRGRNSSIEVYDPTSNQWILTGDLPRAMRSSISVVSHDGAAYLMEGKSLLRYDPTARSGRLWHLCAKMEYERYDYVSAVLDGHLYVLGGWDAEEEAAVDMVERYNFATDRWENVAETWTCRKNCAAGAVDGLLLVAGEGTLEVYNPKDDHWTRGPDMPQLCELMGSAVL